MVPRRCLWSHESSLRCPAGVFGPRCRPSGCRHDRCGYGHGHRQHCRQLSRRSRLPVAELKVRRDLERTWPTAFAGSHGSGCSVHLALETGVVAVAEHGLRPASSELSQHTRVVSWQRATVRAPVVLCSGVAARCLQSHLHVRTHSELWTELLISRIVLRVLFCFIVWKLSEHAAWLVPSAL